MARGRLIRLSAVVTGGRWVEWDRYMGKDLITGLVPGEGGLEWTSVQKTKGSIQKTASGTGDASGIKGDVAACLPSDQVLMRVIELPLVEDDEMRSMVELQVDKFSPFPVENLIVSYEVLDTKGEDCIVLVLAVKNDVVEEFGGRLKELGVKPESIDVDIMGWFRLLRDDGKISPEGRQVVVLLGAVPCILVIQDSVPIAFRSLAVDEDMGLDDIIAEVAQEAGYTLMSLELEHGAPGVVALDVYAEDDVPVSALEELESECGAVPKMQALGSLPPLSEGTARRSLDDSVRRLDLTPESWRAAETSKQKKKKLVSTVAFLTVLWLIASGGFLGYLIYQQKNLAGMKAEQQKWAAPAREVSDMHRRVRLIEQYMDRSDSALECLREVTQLMPPSGIELSTFNYKKNENLTITGEADASPIVTAFNDNLTKSKLFTVTPGERKLIRGKYRFSLVCEFSREDEE